MLDNFIMEAAGRAGRLDIGRGSRIRTCDLKYPKLPRYQTALYPALGRRSACPLAAHSLSRAGAANKSATGPASQLASAISSQGYPGSRQENAIKQGTGAAFRFGGI